MEKALVLIFLVSAIHVKAQLAMADICICSVSLFSNHL